ncbi:MAG TPA: DUF2141 domain-containing protein [Bryobacteraceae bacterium]|nr:DUF2141 domain-containing protein [Bryobacteraceae bacterium]
MSLFTVVEIRAVCCALAALLAPDRQLRGGRLKAATLTINIEHVRNAAGVVGVLVFNSPRGWPENFDAALRKKAVAAHPPVTALVIDDLPYGNYAVVVLHDENENRKLDRNFLGIPREGWGMSNNPRARASAPSFRRARFTLARDKNLRVRLNY